MPSTSEIVTKPSVVQEFITRVMDVARAIPRFTSSSYPTFDHRMWDNGSVTYSGPSPTIDLSPITDSEYDLTNPTESELSTLVYGNEILTLLRQYAYNTTVIRKVRYGKYYTVYYNGQGARTGVPSDDPGHAPWGYNGTFLNGTYPYAMGTTDGEVYTAHLNTDYLQSTPLGVSGPTATQLIDGSDLTDFFNNLSYYAQPDRHDIVDLRICHSSCHNNCHSSRGRR